MPAVPVTVRADLTDAQWKLLEPLLPRGRKRGVRPSGAGRSSQSLLVTISPAFCATPQYRGIADIVSPPPGAAGLGTIAGGPVRDDSDGVRGGPR